MRAVYTRDAFDCSVETIGPVTAARTLAFFKPYGVLSCFTDPEGRPTLAGFIAVPDVYPAGRLDHDTEGLLLLTSDGALAHRITDPRHKLSKIYLVQVERAPDEAALARLRRGVLLGGRRTRPAEVERLLEPPALPPRPVPIRLRKSVPTAWLKVTLREGQNRQIRRMTAAVGHPTLRLVRVAIGPVVLGELQPGQWRELNGAEAQGLRTLH
jgi:23S rRNA pseudouridine2457 synthase